MIPLVVPFIAACAALGTPRVTVPDAVVLGKPYDPQNAFARIVRHQDTQAPVYEDRYLIAFMDYSAASPGHVLVISKTSKARNLLEMKDSDLIRLLHAARRIGRAEMAGLGADGFTIEQNNAYSQSVPHLHVHVIPRYLGYNRCIGSGARLSNADMEKFAARIRGGLRADKGGPVPPRPRDDLPPPKVAPSTGQRSLYSEAADKDHPAAMAAVQIDSHGAKMNAVLYTASGVGPHPTMLLLHGLPGNEQNLDLAQAVRRAGWNVLTFHYRGSWGSPGAFSFEHCAQDTEAALAWLRDPANVTRYGIDTNRLVLAGHSLGGAMAGRVGSSDRNVVGVALIDPADFAAIGRSFADPAVRKAFAEGEIRGDLPPLAGTSESALVDETEHAGAAFDLAAQAASLGNRPLLVIGAERGIARFGSGAVDAAHRAGNSSATFVSMETDHSFSDKRLALTQTIVNWLGQFTP
jgi:diadenosine tetraphosphate (Ap4A) HIT family hydrolase/alpha/beta superfamily hydrolase